MIQSLLKRLTFSEIFLKEVFIIVGTGMAAKGLYMIFPPAMWIGIGLFLLWIGMPDKKVGS